MCPCKSVLFICTQSEFKDSVSFLGQYILREFLSVQNQLTQKVLTTTAAHDILIIMSPHHGMEGGGGTYCF